MNPTPAGRLPVAPPTTNGGGGGTHVIPPTPGLVQLSVINGLASEVIVTWSTGPSTGRVTIPSGHAHVIQTTLPIESITITDTATGAVVYRGPDASIWRARDRSPTLNLVATPDGVWNTAISQYPGAITDAGGGGGGTPVTPTPQPYVPVQPSNGGNGGDNNGGNGKVRVALFVR